MPTFVGIDVGTSAVKVAVVRTAYRKTQLAKLVVADIALSGGVDAAIKKAIADCALGKTVGDAVAIAVSGTLGAVRRVELPMSVAKQVADVLPFELESLVPFDVGESVYDYRVLPASVLDAPSTDLNVMVTLARASEVKARIEEVKLAVNADPERVSLGAFPIASLGPFLPQIVEPGPVMIVDLGTRASDVMVLKNGEPVFARTISVGADPSGLPQSATKLARELRTSIAAYRAAGGATPTRVLLSGGGAFVSGAIAFLAGELELQVELLPAPSIDMTGVDPEAMQALPRFAKAMGLATSLIGKTGYVNLRRGSLAFERGFAWVKEKLPVLVALGSVILVSFVFSAWAQLYARGKEHEVLTAALASVTKEVLGEETDSPTHAQELLSQQTTSSSDDPMPHADAFDVMVKVSDAIPQSMTHDIDELDVQKGHVSIHGIVGSVSDAQSIATSLRSETCFNDVKITRTNQVVGGERQKYQLEFDLKCPEDAKAKKKKETSSSSSDTAASASASTGGK